MNEIHLSYVLTTRNKLLYLKEGMKHLLENLQADEEIVVVDSASTDGTTDYLKTLYEQGKIHQFISEPDIGEGHGYNKCFLMARGALIKTISDDDVFFYPGIQACKQFMLANPDIDILGTEGSGGGESPPPYKITYLKAYQDWKDYGQAFEFGNPGIMLRRQSLPLLGLFDVNYLAIDREYTYRATAGRANVAWFTQICWVHVVNPTSNSRSLKRMKQDVIKLLLFYKIEHPLKIRMQFLMADVMQLRGKLVNYIKQNFPFLNKKKTINKTYGPEEYFPLLQQWLDEQNTQATRDFLYKE